MKHAIPEAVLQQHTAFLGKTGSGKTSTAKLAVEQILRDNPAARVCVLDPIKSDWWGLTSSADGRRPGLPFHILGGPRGHVPLHDSAGKAIGELVANGSLPLSIIDMADFSHGGLQKFFNDFAPALLKRIRGVVYLVIEEAHEFAPKERSGIGNENLAIHYAKKLATAGRSKGIRMMVLTQRTQALHNALLGSCDTMIAHRLTAPADQDPVKKWLKANVNKEIFEGVSDSMSSLKTGSAWICSGEAQVAELVQFPKISTYDNSATPTGDTGDHEVRTAPVDADRLRAIIGDAVKEAEADDPKRLRAEIARLTGLTKAPQNITQNIPDQALIAAAEQRAYSRAFAEACRQASISFEALKQLAATTVKTFAESFQSNIRDEKIDFETPPSGPQAIPPAPAPTRAPPVPLQRKPSPAANGDGTVPKLGAERRPLAALAAAYPAGMTPAQWAVAAGLKRTGGTWASYVSRLRTAGYIEERDNKFFATATGFEAVGAEVEPLPPPGPQLVEFWKRKLSGVGPMLDVLASHYPEWVDRETLAERTNLAIKGGTFASYLSRLKSPGLVETSGSNVRCSASLMG